MIMKWENNLISNKSGFTLLELVIAMMVLAIGLLGIAGLQIVAIRGNATGGQMTLASAAISQKIEQLKTMNYDNLPNEDNWDNEGEWEYVQFIDRQPVILNQKPTDGSFFMTRRTGVNVGSPPSFPAGNLTTVTIQVRWQTKGEGGGGDLITRESSFTTVISDT